MTLINAIPNYQPAPSCGNCNHGYDHVVDGSRNCSLHCGVEDDYLVRIRPDCGDSTSIFNHGPATILVVID
jgi:hypothetical protein